MKNSNKNSFLQKGSVAKRLALITLFGVGFVLPAMNNIALANYGGYSAGGIKADGATGLLTGCDTAGTSQSLTISDFTTSSGNAYWAKNKTTTYGGNYVVLTGIDSQKYTFKVIEYSSSNSTSGVVTLWSYRNNDSAGVPFGSTTFGANPIYSTSKLREFMTGSVASTLSNYTAAMVAYTASGGAAGGTNGVAANGDLIWAPSYYEVINSTSGGMWGLSADIQRADGAYAWLRTDVMEDTDGSVNADGYVYYLVVSSNYRVRPALQLKIASNNPAAFTSDAANITATTMTTGSAGSYEYEPDTSKTATFTPTSGVTLDNLSITVTGDGGGYTAAGLLTTNTGTAWSDISGDISHMATGTTYNLTNADATDRVLRIFGVDDTNKKVTELATGAIAGLSKGSDGKIHMKVSSAINNGVGITLKGGAVVDLAGDASNAITTVASDTGTLNLGTHTYSGTITNGGTLGVKADAAGGTLDSNVSGGTLEITGGLVKYTNANAIGAKTVIKNGAKLDPAANLLNTDTTVESGGELYISTGTLGVDIQGTGTTYIKDLDNPSTAQTITVNSNRSIAGTLNGSGNTIDMTGDNAVTTLAIGTLADTTNLKIDVDMSNFMSDKLAVTNIGGATVNLSAINITKDIATLELPNEEVNKITYVTATNGTATYTLTPSAGETDAIVLTNNYKYTFTKGTTAGTLNYKVETTDLTFKKYAEGTLTGYTTDPATLSLTDDLENTGTGSAAITVGTEQSNTAITVNLNGHNLTSAADSTITVNSGKTFNLNGGSTTAGTTDDKTNFAVNDGGTLNIGGVIEVNGGISGTGAVTNSGELTIEDAAKIQVTGTDGIANTGTINLGGATASTLGGKITGGVLNITGDVSTVGGNLVAGAGTNSLAVSGGKTLTITGGDLARNVTGTTGTTKFTGTSESTATIANKIDVNGGTLTINASNIDGTGNTVTSGTLKLNGGQLDNAVTGAGTTEILADTTLNANLGTAITVDAGKTLTSSANYIGGAVTNNGTITLNGEGTLNQAITTGTLNIGDGAGTADEVTVNAQIGAVTVANDGTLITNADNLTGAVTNNGTVTLNGEGTLTQEITSGTVNIGDGVGDPDKITVNAQLGAVTVANDSTLIINPNNLTGAVTNNGTITLNGKGTLTQAITTGTINIGDGAGDADEITINAQLGPDGTVNINKGGILVISGDNLKVVPHNNGGNLQLTGGAVSVPLTFKEGEALIITKPMTIGNGSSITQNAGSNLVVPTSLVEASTNDPAKAFFQGISDPSQLNVSAGNLTLAGTVQEGKYYVLVAGTAVGTTITKDNLWKLDNIKVEGIFNVEYNTNLTGKSIAIQVTNVTTNEELNTSGLAAVQQGAMSMGNEIASSIADNLGVMSRPSLSVGSRAKIRNVASTNKDDYRVDVVEQGNANEIMPVQVVEKDEYDKTVWASYIRTKETTEGMKLGKGLEGNNTAQYNGAVVGVDFYSSKKAIAGMALSYTTGDINSYSNGTSTVNKSKYYGIALYDRVTNGNTALIYDIGYIRGDNDINQYYNGKDTTSDVRTNTYTAGARWEAAFETGRSKVVPFAAFRYMRVNNGDYTNSHNVKIETGNQNLYIPKVGIAWTGDFIMPKSVWTWRPSVEAGYVWNLGDRTADSNVLMGTRPAAIEYDTVDKSSYYAKAGMEFMHKNFTAGLFYRYLKGDKVRNNKWNINVSWAF